MNTTVNYILLEDESITTVSLQRVIGTLRPNSNLMAARESALPVRDLLNGKDVDLIITDACVADCYCFDMLKRIGCTKPLIVYTAYDKFRDNFNGLNMIDFALKPISAQQLEDSLSAFEKTISQLNNPTTKQPLTL